MPATAAELSQIMAPVPEKIMEEDFRAVNRPGSRTPPSSRMISLPV